MSHCRSYACFKPDGEVCDGDHCDERRAEIYAKLSAAEKERDKLRGDQDTFLAEHDENVRLHFENVDLKEKLAVAEKIGAGWSELLKKEGELHEASVHRNHGEMCRLRSKLAVAVGVLEEFSYRHFDGSKTDYACGDGCDMGDSGHPTDERGHDMDCIFRKATEALKVINGGE